MFISKMSNLFLVKYFVFTFCTFSLWLSSNGVRVERGISKDSKDLSESNLVQLQFSPVPLHYFKQRGANPVHLYTTNINEIENSAVPYDYRGPIGKVYNSPTSGTVPLYRFINLTSSDNFYTTDLAEVDSGSWTQYKFSGIVAYVYSQPEDDLLPFQQFHSRTSGSHLYSTESQSGQDHSDYDFEKVQAYIFPNNYQEFSISADHFQLVKQEFNKELEGLKAQIEQMKVTVKDELLKSATFVLRVSRARIYSEVNGKGKMVEFNMKTNFSVVRCKNINFVVRSIDTTGSCVRLYVKENCDGSVRVVVPEVTNQNDIVKHFGMEFVSAGPCIEVPGGHWAAMSLRDDIEQIKHKLGM